VTRREFITLLGGAAAGDARAAAGGDAVIGFLKKIVPAPAIDRPSLGA
jgi:hypothetical protein